MSSTRIVCITEQVKLNLFDGDQEADKKCLVIHNGVNEQELRDQPYRDLRTEIGIPGDVPVVGLVGRITPWKGHGIVVEAARQLRDRFPTVHYILVGDVFDQALEYQKRLDMQIKQAGMTDRIHCVSYTHNIANAYRAMDIAVLASVTPEPFGLVLVEAMLFSKPVIATRAGGPLEIVVDPETGFFVAPANAGDMAEKLEVLLQDEALCESMGAAGRERALRLFTVKRFQQEWNHLFERTLAASSEQSVRN